MKIDLDDLERKARAATPGPWHTPTGARLRGSVSAMIGGVERQVAGADGQAPSFEDVPDVGERCSANADHIAANSPPVTLALIARILELEDALRMQCDRLDNFHEVYTKVSRDPLNVREILAKGLVLP